MFDCSIIHPPTWAVNDARDRGFTYIEGFKIGLKVGRLP